MTAVVFGWRLLIVLGILFAIWVVACAICQFFDDWRDS